MYKTTKFGSNPVIFLTGATGVLGASLLKDILEQTTCQVRCLVRAKTLAEASARVQSFLSVYCSSDQNEEVFLQFKNRVSFVLGDVSMPQFGLSPEVYEILSQEIDVTFHSAAITQLFLSFGKLEPVNVQGTQHVIDFCLKTKNKYLCYISTYTVMGNKAFEPGFVFKEKDFDVGQSFEYMTYQQSKFLAETRVRKATDQGLVWNIMRPGQIFGASTNGAYPLGQTNVSGLFYDVFKTAIETQMVIDSTLQFDITPVDYVSSAVLYLGLIHPSLFETYHLTNPDAKTHTEIINIIRSFGYSIRFITQDEFKTIIFDKNYRVKNLMIKAFKWWFLTGKFDFRHSGRVSSDYTKGVLAPAKIHCPKINEELIGTYLRYGIKHGYFISPPEEAIHSQRLQGEVSEAFL